jgi:hypothetical protein
MLLRVPTTRVGTRGVDALRAVKKGQGHLARAPLVMEGAHDRVDPMIVAVDASGNLRIRQDPGKIFLESHLRPPLNLQRRTWSVQAAVFRRGAPVARRGHPLPGEDAIGAVRGQAVSAGPGQGDDRKPFGDPFRRGDGGCGQRPTSPCHAGEPAAAVGRAPASRSCVPWAPCRTP